MIPQHLASPLPSQPPPPLLSPQSPYALRLRGVFDACDADHDGLLTVEELRSWMTKLGLHSSAASLLRMVGPCDWDKDDCLNFEEFLALNKMLENESGDGAPGDEAGSSHGVHSGTREEMEMHGAFRVFDKDDNGLISPDELKATLSDMGFLSPETTLSRICSMIRRVDADGDGEVNFAEFESMMKRT